MSPTPKRFDVDLWPGVASLADLTPYFSREWREYLRLRPDGTMAPDAFTRSLPSSVFWRPGKALRESGGSIDQLRSYLDRQQVEQAIINPGVASAVAAVASPFYAAEIARAANEWTMDRWLEADARLRGSILVPVGDPELAVAEVRRLGHHPQMAQILFAYPPRLLGHRAFEPLFESAVEHGLPLALQAGGAFAANTRGIFGVGEPTSAFEHELGWSAAAQHHLTSMICEGVFERHPSLRLVLSGFGVAWLPSLVWRIEREFEERRLAVPSRLSHPPRETIQRHVRLTTSALELPPEPHHLGTVLSLVDGMSVLLYASGPWRGEDEGSDRFVAGLSTGDRNAVVRGNALELFGTAVAGAAAR
jgi:uncharacterized protein